jgi:hypothetical protein
MPPRLLVGAPRAPSSTAELLGRFRTALLSNSAPVGRRARASTGGAGWG